jgi:hypothetical protein
MAEPAIAPTVVPMSAQHVQAYKDATDNLIYLKREQFQITYYTWLLLAALYILSRQIKSEDTTMILKAGVGAVTGASISILWAFQAAINRFRKRLGYIYATYFDETDRIGLGLDAKDSHRGVVGLLTLVCLIAGLFTFKVMLSPVLP